MRLVKLDPPGTWCHKHTFYEMIEIAEARSFIDVGCGAGDLSLDLCRRGLSGIGVDFSENAIAQAKENLKRYIEKGQYKLLKGDVMELELDAEESDLAFSMMVMEHVEDDTKFIRQIAAGVKYGGHVIVAVPGRMDKWGPEDDTVGHLRRYENYQLKNVLEEAGLQDVTVWSVAVPTANILFDVGNFFVKRSKELSKKKWSLREQTETSGVREIPFKTVFPAWFRVILNKHTLSPLFLVQRFFYETNLGLTMMAMGRVVKRKA